MSSLQSKTDGSETKHEETSKLSEGQIKHEVPVIDHDVIIKLEAENEQLKVESNDIGFEDSSEILMFRKNNLYLIMHTQFLGVGQFIGKENRCLRQKARRNKLKHHRAVEGECFIWLWDCEWSCSWEWTSEGKFLKM